MPPHGADRHSEDSDLRWSRLMAAAQDGDRDAYRLLLGEILPFIRAIVARQHRLPDRADDVLQDVLLTLHRVRHTYDPNRSFKHWLAMIARRRSIDGLRRRLRHGGVEIADEAAYETFADPAANRVEEARDAAQELRAAVASLPERQREALEVVKLREMSLREASEATGMSVAALKVNVHRALKALRARLKGE
jgi:RNA polymerase sigma-70 factor (ECF subfamily)